MVLSHLLEGEWYHNVDVAILDVEMTILIRASNEEEPGPGKIWHCSVCQECYNWSHLPCSRLSHPRDRSPTFIAPATNQPPHLLFFPSAHINPMQLVWGENKQVLTISYKAIGRPSINYCTPIYSPLISETRHRDIQIYENAALRTISELDVTTRQPTQRNEQPSCA